MDHLDTPLFTLGETKVSALSFIVFAVSILGALAVASLLRRAIRRYFRRKGEAAEGTAYALERIISLVAVITGVIVGLENVGIDLTALAAVGAVVSLGVGIGLQGFAQSFVSGLIILFERPIAKGDFVRAGDVVGVVDRISLRATRLITRDRVAVIVPNSEIVGSSCSNLSQPDGRYRARVAVSAAYGSDLELVRRTLLAVAAAQEDVLTDPAPVVFMRDFGESSLDFELAVWLASPEPEPNITSDLRFAIDRAFREQGIQIPFPQRDVHVKGVEGTKARLLA